MSLTSHAQAHAIAPRGLDHVVVRVADLERALAFYRDALGFPVERRIEALGLIDRDLDPFGPDGMKLTRKLPDESSSRMVAVASLSTWA